MEVEAAYLVGFMVVLWVVLEDLWALLVVKVPNKIVHTAWKVLVLELSSPFFTIEEPVRQYPPLDIIHV